MKRYLILLFATYLFGANLINVNFFESGDKVDVLLSLDEAFNGKILKKSKNEYVITNITSNRDYKKEFSKSFLKNISILPVDDNKILFTIDSKDDFTIAPALTPDRYGLRIRVSQINKADEIKFLQSQPATRGFDYTTYIILLTVLFVITLILWYIRKKKLHLLNIKKDDMQILMQKPLDAKNRVVLFSFKDKKYLLLVGNSNVLLDVFSDSFEAPKNRVEFDEMLKLHAKDDEVLDKYLKNTSELKDLDEKI